MRCGHESVSLKRIIRCSRSNCSEAVEEMASGEEAKMSDAVSSPSVKVPGMVRPEAAAVADGDGEFDDDDDTDEDGAADEGSDDDKEEEVDAAG